MSNPTAPSPACPDGVCADDGVSASDFLERYLEPGVFRALGDSTRLTLLGRLAVASRPMTVTEASSCCGVHLSGVSRHLRILHRAGLLKAEKTGREMRYQLDCGALASMLRGLAEALEVCQTTCREARCGPTTTETGK